MFVVSYSKRFLEGHLNGFAVPASVRFPTEREARTFVSRIENGGNDLFTGDRWRPEHLAIRDTTTSN